LASYQTFIAPTLDVCKIINMGDENEEEPLFKKSKKNYEPSEKCQDPFPWT
jgi:hypothetical protein